MRWRDKIQLRTFEYPAFRLTLTWYGNERLWSPLVLSDGSLLAVVGYPAFDEVDWSRAEEDGSLPASGGLAAKVLWKKFVADGSSGLDDVSGNYAIIVFDARENVLHLRSDPAGCVPVFYCQTGQGGVWGSHPDVLAAAAHVQSKIDWISLAEFALASTVTPPYTFYDGVRAAGNGIDVRICCHTGSVRIAHYFTFRYAGGPKVSDHELAQLFAEAWKRAVRRRTSSRLGKVFVALSGGMDSRLILAAAEDPRRLVAFTCYDAPNREFKCAKRVAQAAGVEFMSLRRGEDYYGENAAEGVRISGGMGTFANNHFLGVLDELHDAGMDFMLTGCYCDYLFKGLALNRQYSLWSGREMLAPFTHAFYFERRCPDSELTQAVRERWDKRIPPSLQQRTDDAALFDIEVLRTFPVCYEGDNQQRLVPQRLTAWSPPALDMELLRVYRMIPPRLKLNRYIFLSAARTLLDGTPLATVPDANTGVTPGAGRFRETLSLQWLRLLRRIRGFRRNLASDGSWPDWLFYYRESRILRELWSRRVPELDEFLAKVLKWSSLPARPADFPQQEVFLFVALLTLRLWWFERDLSAVLSN